MRESPIRPPVLEHEGTVIGPLRPMDADPYSAATQDQEFLRAFGLPRALTPDEALTQIEGAMAVWRAGSGSDWRFAVRDSEDGPLLGELRLTRTSPEPTVTVSYWVSPEARNEGHGRRVLHLAWLFACEHLGVTHLDAVIPEWNEASIKAAINAGYTCEERGRTGDGDARVCRRACPE